MPRLLANLATGTNFSIDAYVSGNYTHYVKITKLPSKQSLQTFPFDPTDRSVVGALSPITLQALGEHAPEFLAKFAEFMPKKMGAKEIFMIPVDDDKEGEHKSECKLEGYAQPEASGFSRMRHCDRAALTAKTQAILGSPEYKDLTAELDRDYQFLLSEAAMTEGQKEDELYAQIAAILDKARFTSDKQDEYKKEELQGKISRFKNAYVRPVVMVNKKTHQINGLVRALLMGSGFVYLSDEVMNQDLFPLARFRGDTEQDKKNNREIFLMAYLMNKACTLSLADQRQLIIIAADKREKIYEDAGFENFPLVMKGWRCVMKRCDPGPVIKLAQEGLKRLGARYSKAWTYGAVGVGLAVLGGIAFYALSRGSKGDPKSVPGKPDPKLAIDDPGAIPTPISRR